MLTWVQSFLQELGINIPHAPILYCDNISATCFYVNLVFHFQMKYLFGLSLCMGTRSHKVNFAYLTSLHMINQLMPRQSHYLEPTCSFFYLGLVSLMETLSYESVYKRNFLHNQRYNLLHNQKNNLCQSMIFLIQLMFKHVFKIMVVNQPIYSQVLILQLTI